MIISDEWLAPIGVDWETCSIRIAESDLEAMPQILREREVEAERLGAEARRVWRALYAPERRLATLARSCIDIHESLKLTHRLQIAKRGIWSRVALRRARVRLTQDMRRVRATRSV